MFRPLRGTEMKQTAFGVLALAGLVGAAGCVADAEYVDSEDFGQERIIQDWNGTYALTWTCVGSKWSECPSGDTCDESTCVNGMNHTTSASIGGVGEPLQEFQHSAIVYRVNEIETISSFVGTMYPASLNARGTPTPDGLDSILPYVLWATDSGGFAGDISWVGRPPGHPSGPASITVTWHVEATRTSGLVHL
jgi:hypothetical protein